jgi:broad specificity phosphatase PhoE
MYIQQIFRMLSVCGLLLLLWTATLSAQPSDSYTYIIVRHAEKAQDGSNDPALTDIGQCRAIQLAQILGRMDIAELYSTNYQRTRQTVLPLSNSLNKPVQLYDAARPEALMQMVEQGENRTVVVAGHSNTVHLLLNTLLEKQEYTELDEREYRLIFIVSRQKGCPPRLLVMQYPIACENE